MDASPLHLENMTALACPSAADLVALPPSGCVVPFHNVAQIDPDAWRQMNTWLSGGGQWPLVLTGGVGTGKTCAACCLLDQVQRGRYWTFPQLCEHLIALGRGEVEFGQQTDTPQRWWRRYAELDLVVIDELGTRDRVTDFQRETAQRSLDERIGRPTAVVSNLSLGELAGLYDDRIASRLAAGTLLRFEGPDRRLDAAPSAPPPAGRPDPATTGDSPAQREAIDRERADDEARWRSLGESEQHDLRQKAAANPSNGYIKHRLKDHDDHGRAVQHVCLAELDRLRAEYRPPPPDQ